MRIADIATLRPPPPLFPSGFMPNDWAVAHGLLFMLEPLLMDPSSAADNPEAARTESSAASSISRRIEVTERNTPGSIGGGVALPGRGVGNGEGSGRDENVPPGESGGE